MLFDGRVFGLVRIECERQVMKWGVQNRSPFEWLSYLTKEVGELSEAIQNAEYHPNADTDGYAAVEAIQAATLALKIAEMYLNSDMACVPETTPPLIPLFEDRLRLAIGTMSQAAFARKCGFPEGLLRKYLAGTTAPGLDKALAICRTAKINLNWLATGSGEMRSDGGTSREAGHDAAE
jgi:hypothetical protein